MDKWAWRPTFGSRHHKSGHREVESVGDESIVTGGFCPKGLWWGRGGM